MKIEIKNRWNGRIIIAGEYESVKDALQKNRGADLIGANLRGVNLIGANLGGANLGGANLIGANLRGADFIGANLRGADFIGANLRGVDLIGANLRGADFIGADLRGADLIGADLRGANGIILPIITISGTRHTFFYMENIIQIGCEKWPIDYWLKNYQDIGEDNNYTPDQITEYKTYIDLIANFKKENK